MCSACLWQVVGSGRLQECPPWEEGSAASCRTQPCQPTDPPQGTAEPISQAGGASVKKYLRK